MKRWVEWLISRQIALLFGLAVLMVAGVWAFAGLPKDVFPNAAFPRFRVVADLGFSSLQNTDINVTRPLEQALKTVPDVLEVRSVTERGTSTIDLYLRWGSDLKQDLQFVQSTIDQVRAGLPAGLSMVVTKMTTSTYPLSEYGLWSPTLDQKQLFSAVKYGLIPRLIGVDGVASLTVVGGEEPEVWVRLDPRKLVQYDLDAAALENAVDHANKASFLGFVATGPQSLFVVGGRELPDIATLKSVVVASRMGRPVRLGDIAEISDAHALVRRIVSVDGHKGLFIDVCKQPDADALKVSAALDARFSGEIKALGTDVHVSHWDLSDFVRQSIQGILFDILAGVVIILGIVLLVLRRLRFAMPIVLIMPVVLVTEFLVMRLLGQTINIMTLGGLSAAIGIIADNAIVLTENHVHMRAHRGRKGSLIASMQSIVPITVWATVVTVIVFIPLSLLSGVPGLFFGPLAVTLASTIVLSLIAAVVVLPVFLNHFVENESKAVALGSEKAEAGFFRFAQTLYDRALVLALARQKTLAWAVAGALGAAALLFVHLPSGFLPDWDEGDIVLDSVQAAGTNIQEADRVSRIMEGIVGAEPEVRMYIRKTGTGLGDPYVTPNIGEIVILLKADRKRSTFEIMDDLQVRLNKALPDVDVDLHQILPDRLGDLTGEAKPIVVSVVGDDPEALWQAAQGLKAGLETVAGLNGITVNMPEAQPEIEVLPDYGRMALLGLDPDSAFFYSQLALYGDEATSLQHGLQSTPVRFFFEGDFLTKPAGIAAIPIYTANGGVLSLGRIARYLEQSTHPEIHHKNGALNIDVDAELGDRPLSDVVVDVKKVLAGMGRPGVHFELEGNYKNQQTSFHELLLVLGLSVVLILAALLFVFDSWRAAMAVFLGTLASGSFVIYGIALTGIDFDVSSFTGLITVMGIVVNNGILVIAFVVRNQDRGLKPLTAVREACSLRLRPVLITNLAAIAGFLPMALGLGKGAEVLRPFSIAMISGLVGSMAFSLLVMPVFYLLIQKSGSDERLPAAARQVPVN